MSAENPPKGALQLKFPESGPETPKDRHLDGTQGRGAGSDGQVDLAASSDADQTGPFENRFEVLDDVHGSVDLNQLETDAIDSPEFQRLFRLGQLGFVDLVYPTANHTRGMHSIGACHCAKKLIRALSANTKHLNRAISRARGTLRPQISEAERVLISLAGLLHDIPHGPFSHDIEKKTHYIYPQQELKKVKSFYGPYEKHDNFEENPALYVFLMDVRESVLARVLERHSPEFARRLSRADVKNHPHLAEFIKALPSLWPDYERAVLPSLLFHLLVWEKPDEEYKTFSLKLRTSFSTNTKVEWGLGPRKNWEQLHRLWYQPFRHDIVGDTLSADLIDYLARDQARLGMKNQLDLKLLKNYILVPWRPPDTKPEDPRRPQMYRCAIDLNDHKRGTFRAERLNDIFRLLDLRHQIHEKAVYHRVVQSAIAMLSRASLMPQSGMPDLRQLYGLDKATVALAGDDGFLQHLLDGAKTVEGAKVRQSLPCKIAERRVYRPLMVVPGDRVNILLRGICDFSKGLEHPLRELAAIIDSPFFARFFLLISVCIETLLWHAFASEEAVDEYLRELGKDRKRLERVPTIVPKRVIFWTTPYKQLYKDPAILVCVNDELITTIERLQRNAPSEALRTRVTAGVRDAETKNEGLWKFYVFLSDGLFYTGALAHVIPDHPCADPRNHETHLSMAQNVVVRAVRSAWDYWQTRNKSVDLSLESTPTDLADLLEVFSSTLVLFRLGHRDIPGAVSAVRVDQYLHADGSASCRDVRYKFDTSKDLNAVLREVGLEKEKQALVNQAVRATGVDPTAIMGEEMAEIVSRLASASDEDLSKLIDLVSRNRPASDERLMSLWRPDLP